MSEEKFIKKSKIDILNDAIEEAKRQLEMARKEINFAKMQNMKYLILKLREIKDGN